MHAIGFGITIFIIICRHGTLELIFSKTSTQANQMSKYGQD